MNTKQIGRPITNILMMKDWTLTPLRLRTRQKYLSLQISQLIQCNHNIKNSNIVLEELAITIKKNKGPLIGKESYLSTILCKLHKNLLK